MLAPSNDPPRRHIVEEIRCESREIVEVLAIFPARHGQVRPAANASKYELHSGRRKMNLGVSKHVKDVRQKPPQKISNRYATFCNVPVTSSTCCTPRKRSRFAQGRASQTCVMRSFLSRTRTTCKLLRPQHCKWAPAQTVVKASIHSAGLPTRGTASASAVSSILHRPSSPHGKSHHGYEGVIVRLTGVVRCRIVVMGRRQFLGACDTAC